MLTHRFINILCATLMVLFVLTVLGPTDATGAVSSKTASATTANKTTVAKAPSRKGKRSARKSRRRTRRNCNTVAGKQQAIDLVRTQSQELCRLTGLEYVAAGELADSIRAMVKDDAEDVDDASDSGAEATTMVMSPEDEADHAQELLELEAEDDVAVDPDVFRTLWLAYVDAGSHEVTEAGVEKQRLMDMIMEWLGTRYHYGGRSRQGIDCSAFIQELYESVAGLQLPRTAAEQSMVGIPIKDRTKLQFGDLVFFNTRRRVHVSHVGIYLGDNLFAHASSRYGVTISSLESTYYGKRFIGGARLDERTAVQLGVPGT